MRPSTPAPMWTSAAAPTRRRHRRPRPTRHPHRHPPRPAATAAPGGTWAPGVSYAIGARVTYGGLTYQCRQAHTSLPGWEPPNMPALWLRV